MSYAIPSLSRLPVTEKGLVIADFLVPVRVGERTSPRLRNVALVIAGALLIYLTARISVVIPGNPVPFTMQTFGVLVVGGALGLRRGGIAAFLYVALGVIGLPFFAEGTGGPSVIWGATGGYLIGFVAAALLIGRLAELGWDRKLGGAAGATLLGMAVIYAIGVPWLASAPGCQPPRPSRPGCCRSLPSTSSRRWRRPSSSPRPGGWSGGVPATADPGHGR